MTMPSVLMPHSARRTAEDLGIPLKPNKPPVNEENQFLTETNSYQVSLNGCYALVLRCQRIEDSSVKWRALSDVIGIIGRDSGDLRGRTRWEVVLNQVFQKLVICCDIGICE